MDHECATPHMHMRRTSRPYVTAFRISSILLPVSVIFRAVIEAGTRPIPTTHLTFADRLARYYRSLVQRGVGFWNKPVQIGPNGLQAYVYNNKCMLMQNFGDDSLVEQLY